MKRRYVLELFQSLILIYFRDEKNARGDKKAGPDEFDIMEDHFDFFLEKISHDSCGKTCKDHEDKKSDVVFNIDILIGNFKTLFNPDENAR